MLQNCTEHHAQQPRWARHQNWQDWFRKSSTLALIILLCKTDAWSFLLLLFSFDDWRLPNWWYIVKSINVCQQTLCVWVRVCVCVCAFARMWMCCVLFPNCAQTWFSTTLIPVFNYIILYRHLIMVYHQWWPCWGHLPTWLLDWLSGWWLAT